MRAGAGYWRVALAALAAALLWTAIAVSQASADELVEFEKAPAAAANGTIPSIPSNPLEEVKQACGSETATYGSELLNTPPAEIKVPYEWADVIPGKEMELSGTVTSVEFSDSDLPNDHPFSRDFTFNILVNEAYRSLARSLGPGEPEGAGGSETSDHEIHVELETGSMLHTLPQREGPLTGEPWEILKTEPQVPTLTGEALEGMESAYFPKVGERIAIKGRWIIDCGHNDFHSELHPITFMAFGHEEGKKTVVHVLSNAYRDTQLYENGPTNVNGPATGVPFPQAFADTVENVVAESVFGGTTNLKLLDGLEKTNPVTTPWLVCAPPGAGSTISVSSAFSVRTGIKIKVKKVKKSTCASVSTTVSTSGKKAYSAFQPRVRKCNMNWPWLNTKIAEALDIVGEKHSEVEELIVNATGGTYTINYEGHSTGPIAYNASAAEVQSALETLPGIAPGDIAVSDGPGGAGGHTPYILTYGGGLAGVAINQPTTTSSLTGEGESATVITRVPGGELDLRKFILSEVETEDKVQLEKIPGAMERVKTNVNHTPETSCLDPLSAATPSGSGVHVNASQPFPYLGEVTVE